MRIAPFEWNDLNGLRTGDHITIAGVFEETANPDRRWWQFWKPRMVVTERLQKFRVIELANTNG